MRGRKPVSDPVVRTEWGVESVFRFGSQWEQVAGCSRLWDRSGTLWMGDLRREGTTPTVRAS